MTYRWVPAEYARSSDFQESRAAARLARFVLAEDERILDIGSGDGRISSALAARVPRGVVVGVDSSEDKVAHARASHQAPNLRFEVADATHLGFESRFTFAFSNAALHWVRDHRPVLAGIARSLEVGGRVALGMGGHGHAAPLVAAFDRVLMRTEWDYRGHPDCGNPGLAWALYRPEDYEPWLREAGLTPVRVELVSRQARFERFDALAAWLRASWHAYTARVPEGRRDPLIAAVVEAYASGYPEAVGKDGSILVPCVGLDVEAFRPSMG